MTDKIKGVLGSGKDAAIIQQWFESQKAIHIPEWYGDYIYYVDPDTNYAKSVSSSLKCLFDIVRLKKTNSYVDLGLPSGTKWSEDNEMELMTWEEASSHNIPKRWQWDELIEECQWTWCEATETSDAGYMIVGKNNKSIFLPGSKIEPLPTTIGFLPSIRPGDKDLEQMTNYWSKTEDIEDDEYAYILEFNSERCSVNTESFMKHLECMVRTIRR